VLERLAPLRNKRKVINTMFGSEERRAALSLMFVSLKRWGKGFEGV